MKPFKLQDDCEFCCAMEPIPMPKGRSFTSNQLKKVMIKCVKGQMLVGELVKMLRENVNSLEELRIEEIESE